MNPLSLSVVDAARAIGVGRTTMFGILASGVIPSLKVGRRTLVPVAALEQFVARIARPPEAAT